MPDSIVDVAVIGAGPYGLSVAAHLRAAGVNFRIFGSPMRFWRDMLKGSALKTFDFASNIYAPQRGYRFLDYCQARGIEPREPIPMSLFAEYGVWAQQELVPQVEDVQVCQVTQTDDGFVITLASGELLRARRIVVAVGVGYFQNVPKELEHLSSKVLTHTFARRDYGAMAGKDVTVIGGGQSAIEAAAFLQEGGAKTRMLVRSAELYFSDKTKKHRPLMERIKNPQSVAGTGWHGVMLQEAKTLFHFVPEKKRLRYTKRSAFPFGTWWLREMVEGKVTVHLRTHLLNACERDNHVLLTVRDDEGEREIRTDHVVMGTGYNFAVERLPFLAPPIVEGMDKIESVPRLSSNFESSVKGLYFVGPIAAYSFGPLLRFIAGAEFTAPAIARHLARSSKR